MTLQPGQVYWVSHPTTEGIQPHIPHPHVILRHDPVLDTVFACPLTTNTRKISFPGNVLLTAGEANLPRQSAVEVSKALTLSTHQLGQYIGTLSSQRLNQIHAGIQFVERSFFNRPSPDN